MNAIAVHSIFFVIMNKLSQTDLKIVTTIEAFIIRN